MKRADVIRIVKAVVTDFAKGRRIDLSDELKNDLGLDSLDIVEIAIAIESHDAIGKKITISEEDTDSWVSVKDIVNNVCALLEIKD